MLSCLCRNVHAVLVILYSLYHRVDAMLVAVCDVWRTVEVASVVVNLWHSVGAMLVLLCRLCSGTDAVLACLFCLCHHSVRGVLISLCTMLILGRQSCIFCPTNSISYVKAVRFTVQPLCLYWLCHTGSSVMSVQLSERPVYTPSAIGTGIIFSVKSVPLRYLC